jgi:Uma2 family endonuclease
LLHLGFRFGTLRIVPLTIQLPPLEQQTAFNLQHWFELQNDPDLARLPHRIETDRYGHILMSPPPAPSHGSRQLEIGYLLKNLLPRGHALTECPLSTSDGVKAIDVAWLKPDREAEIQSICLTRSPEICVEVLSPSNSEAEMSEKRALYFEAGASEVWFCDEQGNLIFWLASTDKSVERSLLCPQFPQRIPARADKS